MAKYRKNEDGSLTVLKTPKTEEIILKEQILAQGKELPLETSCFAVNLENLRTAAKETPQIETQEVITDE